MTNTLQYDRADRVTHAQELAAFSKRHVAWNMPGHIAPYLHTFRRNQYGTRYIFDDGSVAFVPKGTARVSRIEIEL